MGELGYIGDYIDKDESKNEDINNINQAITEEKENETYSLCSNIKNEIDKIKEIKEKGEINMYVNKIETVSLSKELDKILSNNTTDALEDLICITNGILYNDDIKTITGDEKQKIQTIIGNVFSNPKINSDTVIRYVWKFHCCLSDKKRGIKTESSNNRIEIMNVCYQLAQAKCYAELQSNPQDAKQNLIQLCKILTGRFNGSGQGRENQANKDKIFNNQGLAIAILESLMQINGTIDKIAPIDLLEDESSLKNKECLDFVEDIGKNIPLPLWAEFGLGDFLYFDEEINISKLSSILQSRAIVLKKISEKIKSDKKKALSDFDYEYIEELKKFGAEEAKTQQAKFEIQKDNFKTIIEGKVISDYGDVGNTGILALVYINKTQNAERARNFIPTKEFNLTDIDASIFDLYRDITVDNPDLGYMSDYSNDKKEELNNLIIEGAKMGAMIGGTVLAMVIFPPAGAAGSITLFTLTTSAVAVGVTQGVLTQILYKKLDYDSVGEGVVDIGSQLFFDTATSLIGMKMLGPIKQIRPGLIKDVKNIISNVGITLFDVTVGASAEGVRQMLVNSAFDKQEKVDIMKMIRAGGVMATVFLMVSGGFHVKLPVDDMLRHLKANDPKINPNGFKKLEISEIDYKKSLILLEAKSRSLVDESGSGSSNQQKTNQQKQKINITSKDLIKMDTKLEKLIDTTRNKIKEGTLTQKSKQDMLDEIDIEIKSLDNLQRQGHTNTNANLSNKSQELKLLRQDIEQITIGITPDISVNGKNVELHPDNIDGINSTILNLETQIKYLKKGDSDYEIIFNQLIELRKVQIEIAVYNVFLANNQNLPPTNTNLPPTNTSWNKMSGSTKNRKGVNDNFNKQLYSIISKHEFSINRGKTIQILFDRGILGKISLNDAQRQAIGIPDTIISDMEVTIYVLNKISSSNDMRPTLRLIALASDSSEHITRVVKKYNINNIIDMYIASGGHANFNNSFFEFYSPKLLKLFNEPIYDNGTKISYEAPTIFRKLDTHNTNVTSKIPTEILDELKNVYRNRNITVEQIADPQTKGLDKKTTIIEDKSNTAGYIISQKSYLTIKDNNGIEIGFITRDGTWGRIEVFGSVQQGKTITKGSETYHGYQHFGEIIPRNNYVKQNANANTILDKNTIFFGKNPSGNTNLYISKNTFVGKADGKTYNVIYNVNKGGEYVVHGILESNTDISNIQLNIKNNNIYEQNINTQAIIDFGSITDKTIGCDEAIATYKSHVGASTTLDPNPTQGMNVRFFIK